jgi:hypothetical protein
MVRHNVCIVVLPNEEGAFGAFFRLPAGFVAPLHTHTHGMKVVIVSGTYVQAPEGDPKARRPGAHRSASRLTPTLPAIRDELARCG